MPDYVPIQDLTIVNSIDDSDMFPLAHGSGAYAVRGSTVKSYAAGDAAAAAADAAASKTAAQSAAGDAAAAQSIAESAASDAAAAIAEAEAARLSLGVLPDVFADVPVPGPYFSSGLFLSGYITNTGGAGSNSANARSQYFLLSEVKAFRIPLPYRVKWVWYTSATQAGYIAHEAEYHNCGAGIVNYASPPSNATHFRLQLTKQDLSTITSDDLAALTAAFLAYSTDKTSAEKTATQIAVDNIFTRPLTSSYHNQQFTFAKGRDISTSTGKSTEVSSAARTGLLQCVSGTSYAIEFPAGYRARVFFYTSTTFPTDEDNTYIGSTNMRYQSDGHKMAYTTPENAVGIVFVLYALDWHTLTDADVTVIQDGFRLYRPASSLSRGESYSAPEARERFVAYMAEMCGKLGMNDTTFANASGLTADSTTTAADELKMALAVAGNPVACDIWSTQSRDFTIGGSHARTISVESNVFSDWLTETTYRKLGGKGGTLEASGGGGKKRKAACVMHDISGIPVAISIIGPGDFIYSNIVNCTRELCGMMATKLAGGTPSEGTYLTQLISAGGGYAAVPVPVNARSYANTYDAEQILTRANALYNNEDVPNIPASTTKTMTMLCALSVMSDLQEVISLITSDIKGGSGSTFYSGDKLTLIDALRIMMMESSNTLAECIGRIVGDRLLTIEGTRDV